ncbi:hypothetical protein GCM10010912_53960 [Paenibacillus albidus]|uniref:LysM domain-containing protein n=1 Tax=Paenibacillus albidus TaxID=2041023 RepID=A0A917CYF5_9BACL|nr:LysM peptidoglycan-binding domain-containing protein [Paenibacillus albidus]GGG02358.1 hypothetical protein GCM10010912_53960 [Paenibacillus albidus]
MKIHIVKQGDTLYALSQKYGVPLLKMIEANPQISNEDVLSVGAKVKIPTVPVPVPDSSEVYYKHTVKQGDSLWKLSKAWGIALKEMIDANPQLKNPNALLVGEVVNVPKKNSPSPLQAESVSPGGSAKILPGGKVYTGPKEQPEAAVVPAPAPVPAPPPAPVQVAPVPKVEAMEVKPAPAPVPVPMPEPMPNLPVEIAPVEEKMHMETQSLFVQISVPAEQAVAYKEAPKTENSPVSWAEEKKPYCGSNAGYPGLAENPNFYDCPPTYPFYESMPDNMNMNMNSAPHFVQPMAYMPDYSAPYYYPDNMYAANAGYPGTIAGMNENHGFPENTSPQYGGGQPNLPWPSCGCGSGMPMQSFQPYSHEMSAYGQLPGNAAPGMISPYVASMPQPNQGFPNQGFVPMPQAGMYGSPMVSNILPIPEYPAMMNSGHHNRVPEFQEPAGIAEGVSGVSEPGASGQASEGKAKTKRGTAKSTAPKAKISSQSENSTFKNAKAKQANHNARLAPAKKRKNPWISN